MRFPNPKQLMRQILIMILTHWLENLKDVTPS